MDFYLSQLEKTYDDISLETNEERKNANKVVIQCVDEYITCITEKLYKFQIQSEHTRDIFNIISISEEIEVQKKKIRQMKDLKKECEKEIQSCIVYEEHIQHQKKRIQDEIRKVNQHKTTLIQLRKRIAREEYSNIYHIYHMFPDSVQSFLKSNCL